MLGSPATISTVAAALAGSAVKNVVLDPVLIYKGRTRATLWTRTRR